MTDWLHRSLKRKDDWEKTANLVYADIAEDYARRDEQKWKRQTDTIRELVELCSHRHPQNILELGVGTGRYFPFLSGKGYVGVDICEPMLGHARQRESLLRERGFVEVTFAHDDIESYCASAQDTFQMIFSIGCVGHHVPISLQLMKNCKLLLAAGGYIYLQTTQTTYRKQVQHILRRWKNQMYGRPDKSHFYATTNPSHLHRVAIQAGFSVEWIREDRVSNPWNGRPLLISLFSKP